MKQGNNYRCTYLRVVINKGGTLKEDISERTAKSSKLYRV